MFGDTTVNNFSKITIFRKNNIIPKSIILTERNKKREDIKLNHIDFNEWCQKDKKFEDSKIFEYFYQHQIVFSIFKIPYEQADIRECQFVGCKHLKFTEEFIDKEVKKVWEEVRNLVNNHKLKEDRVYKKDGEMRINKTGVLMKTINFPKASCSTIFFKGSRIKF